MSNVYDNLRWPNPTELELNDEILKGKGTNAVQFQRRVEIVSQFLQKNYKRFRLEDLKKVDADAKDKETANQWKQKGNTSFANKCWTEALKYYTEVICSSPADTEELAFGYANRSACLYYLKKYEDAIEDATKAIDDKNYPKSKLFKVYQRRGLCYFELGNSKKALDEFEKALICCKEQKELPNIIKNIEKAKLKLEAPQEQSSTSQQLSNANYSQIANVLHPHPSLAYASASIGVKYAVEVGRYVVATNSISAGEVLIREEPYAAVLLREHELTRCNGCSWSRYCSAKCRDDAWSYHSFECKRVFMRKAPTYVMLCLRILFRNHLETKTVQITGSTPAETPREDLDIETIHLSDEGNPSMQQIPGFDSTGAWKVGDYATIYSLEPHLNEMSALAMVDVLFNAQITKICWENTTDVELDVVTIVHHLCQFRTNIYAVTEVSSEPETDSTKSTQKVSQIRVAEAIYSTCSLLNHSCRPNTSLEYQGRSLIIRASEIIPCGVEVSNCYGPHVGHMVTKQRREALRKQYYFDCNCLACSEKEEYECFACPNCGPEVPLKKGSLWTVQSPSEADTYYCQRCKAEKDGKEFLSQESLANDLYEKGRILLDEADDDAQRVEAAIKFFGKCASIRESIYYKYHPTLGRVYDALAESYATIEEYEKAIPYCRTATAIVSRIFGEDSVEISHELFKLTQLCFNGKKVVEAMENIERTKAIMQKYHNDQYELLVELEQMKKSLLDFLENTVGPYWST